MENWEQTADILLELDVPISILFKATDTVRIILLLLVRKYPPVLPLAARFRQYKDYALC